MTDLDCQYWQAYTAQAREFCCATVNVTIKHATDTGSFATCIEKDIAGTFTTLVNDQKIVTSCRGSFAGAKELIGGLVAMGAMLFAGTII